MTAKGSCRTSEVAACSESLEGDDEERKAWLYMEILAQYQYRLCWVLLSQIDYASWVPWRKGIADLRISIKNQSVQGEA